MIVPRCRVGVSEIHGQGVFAALPLGAGDLVESCPVIAISGEDSLTIDTTGLGHYTFEYGDGAALALGSGSLYNHSYKPNCRYEIREDEGRINFYALRNISTGMELLINYNGDPDCQDPVF